MALSFKKQGDGSEGAPEKKSRSKSKSLKPAKSSGALKKEAKSKGSSKRFVLIIGDEGAILVFMQGVKVVRRLFAPSPQLAHSEAITELMKSNPTAPIYVLMDVLDQQYIPQTFPPVSPLSVGGLVKRRLDRDFQPDDFKGSLPLGRDKVGRKEWKFLLVALAKTPLVSEWVERIVDLPNELKGVYLVPIEAVNYIAQLGKKLSDVKPSSWQILLSHNKISGFRQVVVRDHKLVFTRVSQAIDDAVPAVIAGNIEQEIINTIEYLKRLEFRDNSDIDATVVVSQDVIETLDLNRFGFAKARAVTPIEVADALGLEQAALSADRFGDVVLAAAFGIHKKHVLRFSNAYIEKLAKIYKARVAILAAAALSIMLIVLLSGLALVGMLSDYSAISELKAKTRSVQPELEKTKKSVDGLNQDVAFKSAFVAAYDAYVKDSPLPEDFVAAVAPLISAQARIVSFNWDNIATASVKSGQNAAPVDAKLPILITMEVDFAGSGTTLDVVDQAAKNYVTAITTALPQYEVTHAPFPWQENEASNATEIELNAASAVQVKDSKVKFSLRGIKAAASASPPARGAL